MNAHNPNVIIFTKQQMDSVLRENAWLKHDNAMQRAVNAGLRERILKWELYAKLLKRELEKKDEEIKKDQTVSSPEGSPPSGLEINGAMQMATAPRRRSVVRFSAVPVPVIERAFPELRGDNPLTSGLRPFPLFSLSLLHITLDAPSRRAAEGAFISFESSFTPRKRQDVIGLLCLPSPPSVLPVNSSEATSSTLQEDSETEKSRVSAIPPSPLKLQSPSSERHEDMSYQPPPPTGVQFVDNIINSSETSHPSSSLSMPQVDVSIDDEEDAEEGDSGITEGSEYSTKKLGTSLSVLNCPPRC
ncbi:hypothetical protein AWC38_SpisGene16459 [Stylophora pistillata]|uniref:Uncharacterized protein n=1 Tax=Stylophora pistillata TaxID=50429 RepID=A0A2B4RRF0_STYPI|nr:hypothetical protein AWC38_SpisGene16459 [Stylophora pistillata]